MTEHSDNRVALLEEQISTSARKLDILKTLLVK